MHAVPNDEDQGRLIDGPVPIGQEGRTGARMRDLRCDSGRGEFENSHGDVFLGVARECQDLTRAWLGPRAGHWGDQAAFA